MLLDCKSCMIALRSLSFRSRNYVQVVAEGKWRKGKLGLGFLVNVKQALASSEVGLRKVFREGSHINCMYLKTISIENDLLFL
jgi:hypothetical protein